MTSVTDFSSRVIFAGGLTVATVLASQPWVDDKFVIGGEKHICREVRPTPGWMWSEDVCLKVANN